MMNAVKPSKKWYILAVGLMVVGACLLIYSIAAMLASFSDENKQYIAAEKPTIVTVSKDGKCEIYYEYRTAFTLNQDLVFQFKNTATGEVTQSTFPRGSANYSAMGVNGQLIATVQLQEGTYEVSSNYVPDGNPITLVFYTGAMVVGMVAAIFMMVGSIFAGIAGFIVLLILFVMRRNNRKKLEQAGGVSSEFLE